MLGKKPIGIRPGSWADPHLARKRCQCPQWRPPGRVLEQAQHRSERLVRHNLPLKEERGAPRQGHVHQPHPPEEAPASADA